MTCPENFKDYSLNCENEDNLDFFKTFTAADWCFKTYLENTHPESKKQKPKQILFIWYHYLNDLRRIELNKKVPKEIKDYVTELKNQEVKYLI